MTQLLQVGLNHFLLLSAALFAIGLFTVAARYMVALGGAMVGCSSCQPESMPWTISVSACQDGVVMERGVGGKVMGCDTLGRPDTLFFLEDERGRGLGKGKTLLQITSSTTVDNGHGVQQQFRGRVLKRIGRQPESDSIAIEFRSDRHAMVDLTGATVWAEDVSRNVPNQHPDSVGGSVASLRNEAGQLLFAYGGIPFGDLFADVLPEVAWEPVDVGCPFDAKSDTVNEGSLRARLKQHGTSGPVLGAGQWSTLSLGCNSGTVELYQVTRSNSSTARHTEDGLASRPPAEVIRFAVWRDGILTK